MKIEQTLLFEKKISDQFAFQFSVPGFTLFQLPSEKLARLLEVWPVDLKAMRVRKERGDWCFVVADGQGLVHYSWGQLHGRHYIGPAGRSARIKENEIWIYHCRTADRVRGKGIYPAVLKAILAEAATVNIERAVIYTTVANLASQNGIRKAGFAQKAVFSAVKFGKITIPWVNF